VVQKRNLNKLPFPHPKLLGLMTLRGEVIPVLNLYRALGPTVNSVYAVVCRISSDLYAFPVDEAQQVNLFDPNNFQVIDELTSEKTSGVITHLSIVEDATYLILDIGRMIEN
jgi:chemotaxis signal transduction protein